MTLKQLLSFVVALTLAASVVAQTPAENDSAPTFRVPQSALSAHPTVIAYGDQRFHAPNDPKNGSRTRNLCPLLG